MLPPFSSYYYRNYCMTFFLIFLLSLIAPPVLPAHQNNAAAWQKFTRFVDAQKGSQVNGISELKTYFQRFGYLSKDPTKSLTDLYDDELESAVSAYQKNMGLSATGKLDDETMKLIMTPRCGVSDETSTLVLPPPPHNVSTNNNELHATVHYSFFKNEPKWARPAPIQLTYAFSSKNMVDYLSAADMRPVFERAFARWSSVTPVTFTETNNYLLADIKIGFYWGDHGDGNPFDGSMGVLAHSFEPESGWLHLDGAETWAVDLNQETAQLAFDLESVAIHEIGHILGLGHTPIKEAIMYPSISPRMRKVDLNTDDVQGIQTLYGSNPNSNPNFKPDFNRGGYVYDSSSWSVLMEIRRSLVWNMVLGTMALIIL